VKPKGSLETSNKDEHEKLPSEIVGCGIMISTPTAPLNEFSASETFSYYQNEPYYPSDDFGRLLESACKIAITEAWDWSVQEPLEQSA